VNRVEIIQIPPQKPWLDTGFKSRIDGALQAGAKPYANGIRAGRIS
jgi:hypothetical protein